MPYDSSGNFGLVNGYRATTGQTILASQHNPPLEDIASGLSQVLLRSGIAPMMNNLNMNGFRVVNIGNATDPGDAVTKSQLDEIQEKFSSRSNAYTATDSDYNTFFRFTATATLSISDAASLRTNWMCEVYVDSGLVTIDPANAQTINGAASLILSRGQSARIFRASDTAFIAIIAGGIWGSKAIGEIYMVDTSLTGVEIPPSAVTDIVYIELTAGLTGAGQFNEGKLTNESVTGSVPLVNATARISVTDSPMNGQTVRLINTESRILRPSTVPGALQNDALQNITGGLRLNKTSSVPSGAFAQSEVSGNSITGQNDAGTEVTFDASRVARTANETRMKNVGVKAYMRVK